jgi:hypothetical protein
MTNLRSCSTSIGTLRRLQQDQAGPCNSGVVEFTLVPKGVAPIAAFMFKVSTIKTKPASWKDLFFANVHDQAES